MYCSKSSGLWIVPKQFLTLGLLVVNVLVTNKCFVCAKVFVTVRTVVTECVGKVLGFHMVFDNPKLFLLIGAQLTANGSCLQSLNKLFKVFRLWDRPWKIICSLRWGKSIKQKILLIYFGQIQISTDHFYVLNSCDLEMLYLFQISWHRGDKGRRMCWGSVWTRHGSSRGPAWSGWRNRGRRRTCRPRHS